MRRVRAADDGSYNDEPYIEVPQVTFEAGTAGHNQTRTYLMGSQEKGSIYT